MLAYLDTIIAFAVIMLGFSLLITILNQAVSAFLGYRGSNLRWGIRTMLSTLDPNLSAQAKEIANRLLTEPAVSDSIFARFKDWPVLKFITRRWRLASAIGPDALVRALTKLSEDIGKEKQDQAGNQANQTKPFKDWQVVEFITRCWRGLVRALTKVSEDMRKEKQDQASNQDNQANHGVQENKKIPRELTIPERIDLLLAAPDAGAVRKLEMVKGTIGTILADTKYEVQLDDLLKQLGTSAQQSVGTIEAWFDIAMKRVSQRFTMQIRIWTVVFAVLLAFGVHLDSFNLFNQLLGNPALRQKLVNQSEAMLKEADAVLGTPSAGNQTSQSSELTVSPEVLVGQMKELIDKDIDKSKEGKGELLGRVPKFNNISEAETWLRNNLKPEVSEDRKKELATKYRGRVISGLRTKAKDISDLFQKAGIDLLPEGRKVPKWNNLKGWKAFFYPDSKRNFFGILLTAGLLGLGAPFWYNALKTLTNLRPMVATKQDQQKQEAAAS
jgi:hypothetical protein